MSKSKKLDKVRPSFSWFRITESIYPIIYRIRIQALRHNVPSYILLRIALIESAFNPNAVGQTGDYGLFQITQPVVDDYNGVHGTNHRAIDLIGNETLSAEIAAWHMRRLLNRYENDVSKAVRAYNVGSRINSPAALAYWTKFVAAATIFPE